MSKESLKAVVAKVFLHAGIVQNISITWEKEDLAYIKIMWRPWSSTEVEDVTMSLLEAGMIVDDSYLYKRIKRSEAVVTANIMVDLASDEWRRDLCKQLGYIMAAEVRAAVAQK